MLKCFQFLGRGQFLILFFFQLASGNILLHFILWMLVWVRLDLSKLVSLKYFMSNYIINLKNNEALDLSPILTHIIYIRILTLILTLR